MARQTSISASAIIPAPPERVWEIACDTSRYPTALYFRDFCGRVSGF